MNKETDAYIFWKEFRMHLTNQLKEEKKTLDKTPENICSLAKKIGIKPAARYFEIQPSQIRYYLKKEKTS